MMRERVKRLWRLCFDDCEAFVDLYFRLRYSDEVNVAMERGGEVIAALQMLPYPMTFCGNEIETAYVSGACTHPDYRNRGVMRTLLKMAFERMWQKRIALSTLIPAEPWLFDYYASSGFAAVLHHEKAVWQDEGASIETASQHIYKVYREDVFEFLDRKLRERRCCVLHTREDFKVVMEDLQREGGCLHAWEQAGKVVAMEVAYPAPPPLTTGMARIVHAEEVLQRFAAAYPEKELRIALTDNQLPQNNGCYLIGNGTCQKREGLREAVPCTINQLTEQIFAPLHPVMSLMMN